MILLILALVVIAFTAGAIFGTRIEQKKQAKVRIWKFGQWPGFSSTPGWPDVNTQPPLADEWVNNKPTMEEFAGLVVPLLIGSYAQNPGKTE